MKTQIHVWDGLMAHRFRKQRSIRTMATSMLYSKLFLTVPMLFTLIVIISLLIIVGLTHISLSLKAWMRYLGPRSTGVGRSWVFRALISLVFNLEATDRKIINPTTDWHTHMHLHYIIFRAWSSRSSPISKNRGDMCLARDYGSSNNVSMQSSIDGDPAITWRRYSQISCNDQPAAPSDKPAPTLFPSLMQWPTTRS